MATLHQSIRNHSENSYKTRMVSWLRPTSGGMKSLLSDDGISLQKAIFWLAIASIFYAALNHSILFYNNHQALIPNISNFVGKVFTSSAIQLVSYFLFCGVIHLVSKLFQKNGNLRDYLIVYSFFNAPSIVIFGSISSTWYIFHSIIGLVGALLFSLYYLFWLNTIAIAFVYEFRRVSAFVLNFLITAILASILFALYLNRLL